MGNSGYTAPWISEFYERKEDCFQQQRNFMKSLNTKRMVLIALVTAITCILAPFSIPLPFTPVPITLTNLVILTGVYLLGWKDATISYIVYLLLGMVGLPVFSGFSGGLGKLAGPTGGYLIGFIFLTVIAGLFVEKFPKKIYIIVPGMILGMAVTYLFGTIWLAYQMSITFPEALLIGVVPYLIGDGIKIVLAVILGPILRDRVSKIKN